MKRFIVLAVVGAVGILAATSLASEKKTTASTFKVASTPSRL